MYSPNSHASCQALIIYSQAVAKLKINILFDVSEPEHFFDVTTAQGGEHLRSIADRLQRPRHGQHQPQPFRFRGQSHHGGQFKRS